MFPRTDLEVEGFFLFIREIRKCSPAGDATELNTAFASGYCTYNSISTLYTSRSMGIINFCLAPYPSENVLHKGQTVIRQGLVSWSV